MAQVWMHNGFLQVEGEKMAKSAGNFVTVHELLHTKKFGSNKWHGYVVRLAMLMTQYRQPVDWTVERLVEARACLKEWIDSAIGADQFEDEVPGDLIAALEDDLNTPAAISLLHAYCRNARRLDIREARKLAAALKWLGIWNGENTSEIYSYGYDVRSGPSESDLRPLIDARNAARAAKNFKEADRIRDELEAMGVTLKDAKDPKTGELVTTWEIAR
jgi:cysteinyl-tRNA synthetase